MTLQPIPSEFPYRRGKFFFLLISVVGKEIARAVFNEAIRDRHACRQLNNRSDFSFIAECIFFPAYINVCRVLATIPSVE